MGPRPLRARSADRGQYPLSVASVGAQANGFIRTQLALMVRLKNNLTPEQQAQLREIRGKGLPGRRLPPGPRPQ